MRKKINVLINAKRFNIHTQFAQVLLATLNHAIAELIPDIDAPALSDWFTSPLFACAWFYRCYRRVQKEIKSTLWNNYRRLCLNGSKMVRIDIPL